VEDYYVGAPKPPARIDCWGPPGRLKAPPGKIRNLGGILMVNPVAATGGQKVDVTLPCGYNLTFRRELRPTTVVFADAADFFRQHLIAIGYRATFRIVGPYHMVVTVPPVGHGRQQMPPGKYVVSIGNGPFRGFGVWTANTVVVATSLGGGGGGSACWGAPGRLKAPPGKTRNLGGIMRVSPTAARGGQVVDVTLPCGYNLTFNDALAPTAVVFADSKQFFKNQSIATGYLGAFTVLGPYEMSIKVPPVGNRFGSQMPAGTYVISIGNGPFQGFGVWTSNTMRASP
jgi:hypothetical protein